MRHNKGFETSFRPLLNLAFGLLSLSLVGCGERHNDDDLVVVNPEAPNQGADAVGGNGFVVSGPNQGGNSLGDCLIDLRQDVIINPKGGSIRVIFSGKVAKPTECLKENRAPVLLVSSPVEFSIHPNYGCKVTQGEFNVRCNGPLVKVTDDGRIDITINGDGQFDYSKVRMRLGYEKAPATAAQN